MQHAPAVSAINCQPHPACAQLQEAAARVLRCTEAVPNPPCMCAGAGGCCWRPGMYGGLEAREPLGQARSLLAQTHSCPGRATCGPDAEQELGEGRAGLAAGMLGHLGDMSAAESPSLQPLLALQVDLSDSLSAAPSAARQDGSHPGRSSSVFKTETCWGSCAAAVALCGARHHVHFTQHAALSLATGCEGVDKAGRVQEWQLLCGGCHGSGCPEHEGVHLQH